MEAENTESLERKDLTNLNNSIKRERNFPALDLRDQATLSTENQPVLVVQSPKTPTLSRKLKAVSLDSEPQPQGNTLEVCRDVFSMPNTPKRQIKQKLSCDFDDGVPKSTLAPSFSSNLKKFASNNSISGSQTLKTLPEINALQDFSDCPIPEPQKVRTKGLLERRGSNASLTIDLGSSQNVSDVKPVPLGRLNTAKSVSNLYLSSMNSIDKCVCSKKCEVKMTNSERRNSKTETCGNCTIYESTVPKLGSCKPRCQSLKRCSCCSKSRRKSLSNENLYVPPCGFCESENRECPELKNCKGNNRKAVFPRQPDLEASQLLSDDFKMHLQNVQYLQTAGNVLSVEELKQSCEVSRVPKLHQEFWEVPLNLQEKCYVSGSQSKNRYRGVLPNEHSRVHLPSSGGYIHANYIKGPDYTETAYIATQGPLSHTCTDFWEMVWHSQCKCIVMLTGLVEKGRNKCELYFPLGKTKDTAEKTFFYVKTPKVRDKFTFESKNVTEYDIETYEFEEKNEVTFGDYQIKYVDRRDLDQCQIRELQLKKTDLNVKPRTIHHYWLSEWPDHKMANPEQVLKIALDVLKVIEGSRSTETAKRESVDLATQQVNPQGFSEKGMQGGSRRFRFDLDDSGVSIDSSTGDEEGYHKDNGQSRFSFDSDKVSETTVTHSDCIQVTGSQIETVQTRTFTFSVNSSVVSENTTCEISSCGQTEYSSSNAHRVKRDASEASLVFAFDQASTSSRIESREGSACSSSNAQRVKRDTSDAGSVFAFDQAEVQSCSATPCPQKASTSSSQTKSREGSISDFNKETLSNRCSLDSKLGNFNKMSEFKSQFKKDVSVMSLKSKTCSLERKKSAENVRLPVIVHCSAGIGRTGCFLAILNGIQQLKMNVNVDVLAILCSLRLNRGGMVQTAEQYELIHRVLSLYSDSM